MNAPYRSPDEQGERPPGPTRGAWARLRAWWWRRTHYVRDEPYRAGDETGVLFVVRYGSFRLAFRIARDDLPPWIPWFAARPDDRDIVLDMYGGLRRIPARAVPDVKHAVAPYAAAVEFAKKKPAAGR